MQKKFVLLILLIVTSLIAIPQVVINEIMSSNRTCVEDEDGDNPDWIELYNVGDTVINLKSYFISDNPDNQQLWKFPEVEIAPGEFLLIFASGKNRKGSVLHTNFSISKMGEPILLSNPNGELIDSFQPAFVQTDYSMGRYPDGSDNVVLFKTPTPEKSNTPPYTEPIFAQLDFSHSQGYHKTEFLLNISSDKNVEIRYTKDGSKPYHNSQLYTGAIDITSRKGDENIFSEIPSAVGFYWRTPKKEIPKINVIRAMPFVNGIPVGNEISGTFWTGHHANKDVDILIISLAGNKDCFFGYEDGIYVPGKYYDMGKEGNYVQRGRDYEREVSLSFFNPDGELIVNQNAGARIHGQSSREFRQKSIRLYARNTYGNNKFEHDFFPDRENTQFRRLLINSTMGDRSSETLFKDEMCTYLIKDLNLDYLDFVPAIVFINGEYWGLHFLKERRDLYYIENNHNIDGENVDWLQGFGGIIHGSNSHFFQLIDFLRNEDLSNPDAYDKIDAMIDVDNFIDYM